MAASRTRERDLRGAAARPASPPPQPQRRRGRRLRGPHQDQPEQERADRDGLGDGHHEAGAGHHRSSEGQGQDRQERQGAAAVQGSPEPPPRVGAAVRPGEDAHRPSVADTDRPHARSTLAGRQVIRDREGPVASGHAADRLGEHVGVGPEVRARLPVGPVDDQLVEAGPLGAGQAVVEAGHAVQGPDPAVPEQQRPSQRRGVPAVPLARLGDARRLLGDELRQFLGLRDRPRPPGLRAPPIGVPPDEVEGARPVGGEHQVRPAGLRGGVGLHPVEAEHPSGQRRRRPRRAQAPRPGPRTGRPAPAGSGARSGRRPRSAASRPRGPARGPR